MPAPRKPQDHKAKASKAFTFEHDGETYTLPPFATGVDLITGQQLRDGMLGGPEGEARMAFLMLEAVETEPGAIEALYAKQAPEMLEILGRWMRETGEASVPQS